jgi:hypothetical protein
MLEIVSCCSPKCISRRWSNSNAFIRPVVLEFFLQGKYLQYNNEKVLKVDELDVLDSPLFCVFHCARGRSHH